MFKMHIQPDRKKLQILEWKERDNNKTTTPGKQITPALPGRKKIENIENMMTSVVLRRSLVRSVRLLQERSLLHTSVQPVSIFESFKKSQPQQFGFDYPKSCSTLPKFSDVNYDQLVEILKNNKATVIDVRNPEELIDYGAIPGAVNIPLKKLKVKARIDF